MFYVNNIIVTDYLVDFTYETNGKTIDQKDFFIRAMDEQEACLIIKDMFKKARIKEFKDPYRTIDSSKDIEIQFNKYQ